MTRTLPSTNETFGTIVDHAKTDQLRYSRGDAYQVMMQSAGYIGHAKPTLLLSYGAYKTPLDYVRVARGLAKVSNAIKRGDRVPLDTFTGAIKIAKMFRRTGVQISIERHGQAFTISAQHWLPVASLLK
jgi:hypothetical protein